MSAGIGRAEELYERVKRDGDRAIDEFICDRVSEELFLDFKRSSDEGRGLRLSQNDRSNLAKAISGFGNCEGGLLIWGVDCSQSGSGADVAQSKYPIADVRRYVSWLEGVVSGCTVPPHSGVQNFAVRIGTTNDGFAVTYVPRSDHAPHQVIGRLQYYMRAGSSFSPVPHMVLAGMFGRAPHPHVFHAFAVAPAKIAGAKASCEIGLMIRNEGPGIARDLFANIVFVSSPGEHCQLSAQPQTPQIWSGNFTLGTHISLISDSNFRLPPKAQAQPMILNIAVEPPYTDELKIRGMVGAGNSTPYHFSFERSAEEIKSLYDDLLSRHRAGTLTRSERRGFVESLIRPNL